MRLSPLATYAIVNRPPKVNSVTSPSRPSARRLRLCRPRFFLVVVLLLVRCRTGAANPPGGGAPTKHVFDEAAWSSLFESSQAEIYCGGADHLHRLGPGDVDEELALQPDELLVLLPASKITDSSAACGWRSCFGGVSGIGATSGVASENGKFKQLGNTRITRWSMVAWSLCVHRSIYHIMWHADPPLSSVMPQDPRPKCFRSNKFAQTSVV